MKAYSVQLSALMVFFATIPAIASTRYVNAGNSSPVPPYLTPANAAVTIQDAVDVAAAGDLIIVTNGTYQTGGRLMYGAVTNRVVINKAVTVQSVNGPAVTVIKGFQVPGTTNGAAAIRCAYLTNGAMLSGFTLTGGATDLVGDLVSNQSGGAVWCESPSAVLSNCVLSGCLSDSFGGGAFSGTLNHCTISGNATASQGGGAYQSYLTNCTLSGNVVPFQGGAAYGCVLDNCVISNNTSFSSGGGLYSCVAANCVISSNSSSVYGGGSSFSDLHNCTVVNNRAITSGGGVYKGNIYNCIVWANVAPDTNAAGAFLMATYCCSTPLLDGPGNFSNPPQFVNLATGNLRLASTSPCINAGQNASAPLEPDLDGNPRFSGGTVDVGAYEFQNPSSQISFAWLLQYGLPNTGVADFVDTDLDGLNNWQEWKVGTVPIDPGSVLIMYKPSKTDTGIVLTWQSVSGVLYFVERSDFLGAQPPFTVVQSNIVGQAGTTSYMVPFSPGIGPICYRVGVQ